MCTAIQVSWRFTLLFEQPFLGWDMHCLYFHAISFVHDGAVNGSVTINDVVDADLRHRFCNEELKMKSCINMVISLFFVLSESSHECIVFVLTLTVLEPDCII